MIPIHIPIIVLPIHFVIIGFHIVRIPIDEIMANTYAQTPAPACPLLSPLLLLLLPPLLFVAQVQVLFLVVGANPVQEVHLCWPAPYSIFIVVFSLVPI